jgi:hypothetical protein
LLQQPSENADNCVGIAAKCGRTNFDNANRPLKQQARAPQNNQTFDSNGPTIKIRGNAYQIFERYLALAREAATSDDRIAAENFYQHAEHYFRIDNARREGHQPGMAPRPAPPDEA